MQRLRRIWVFWHRGIAHATVLPGHDMRQHLHHLVHRLRRCSGWWWCCCKSKRRISMMQVQDSCACMTIRSSRALQLLVLKRSVLNGVEGRLLLPPRPLLPLCDA